MKKAKINVLRFEYDIVTTSGGEEGELPKVNPFASANVDIPEIPSAVTGLQNGDSKQ